MGKNNFQNNQNSDASLKKSHSKWSNTKLTTLCIVSSVFVSAFWAVLALKENLSSTVLVISLVVTLVVSMLTLIGFSKFTR